MMKRIPYLLLLAATLLNGCTKPTDGSPTPSEEGFGNVRISTSVSATVGTQTRAEATTELPTEIIPDGNTLPLHIVGIYSDNTPEVPYDQEWTSLSEFDSPMMPRGSYIAELASCDGEAEGPDAACFAGKAEFSIRARETSSTDIVVALQNAAVQLTFDKWFTSYYSEAEFTLRTETGNTFNNTPDQRPLLFVKPDTKLYLSGTAVKSQNGVKVEFPEAEIGTSAARTLHTVQIRASQVGSSGLTIQLDDTFTEIEETVIELNPEA